MNEAVVYTGFCDRTLRQYIADGKLRAYRAGRAFRFKKTDLDALFTATDRWGA
ncbi:MULTISPECIES: excisionase family DNA-binding protein [Corynebacterium]|uniref:excisionase family DNA-binding protein n=1 Tax=unclassified Corynebacterium TaxID=2624378 RepID=UPI0009F73C4E|nr:MULTISPECIES: excisionase family DNA-binding protein [unclassified Corynebacterium]MBC6762520.1 helix-turn-helix domain-containing protein [Corynebacterium sp. LK27]